MIARSTCRTQYVPNIDALRRAIWQSAQSSLVLVLISFHQPTLPSRAPLLALRTPYIVRGRSPRGQVVFLPSVAPSPAPNLPLRRRCGQEAASDGGERDSRAFKGGCTRRPLLADAVWAACGFAQKKFQRNFPGHVSALAGPG